MANQFHVAVSIGGAIDASLNSAIKTTESRFGAMAGSIEKSLSKISRGFSGIGSAITALGLGTIVRDAIDATEQFQKQLVGLASAGRTYAEINEGIAASHRLIADSVPSASMSESLRILQETTGALGNYKEALENLPFTAKLAETLKFQFPGVDSGSALNDLSKFAEIAGRAQDPKKFQKLLEGVERGMLPFGGRLNSNMFLEFAQNAVGSTSMLSDRFLTSILPSLITETSGSKVGTGLTGFERLISGQRLSDKQQAQAWEKLGLLDASKVKTNPKTDAVIGWISGAVKSTGLAETDPLKFAEEVLLPAIKKSGVNIDDQEALKAALAPLFKDKRAFDFIWSLVTQANRTRLHKDENLIGKTLGLDKQYDLQLHTIGGSVDALKSSLANLGVALFQSSGGMISDAILAVSRGINAVGNALSAHPLLAQGLTAFAGAITAVGIAAGAVGLAALAGIGPEVLAVGAAIGTVAAGIAVAWPEISSFFSGFALGVSQAMGPNTRALFSGIADAIGALKSSLGNLAGSWDDNLGQISVAGQHFAKTVGGAIESVVTAIEKLIDAGSRAAKFFHDNWFSLGPQGGTGLPKLGNGGMDFSGAGASPKAPTFDWWNNFFNWRNSFGQPQAAPFGGARALGGDVDGDKFYVVGENGPELLIPGLRGTIVPNSAFGGLASIGGTGLGGGSGGGGGIPGSSGSWSGGMGRVGGSSPWHTSSQQERASFIRDYAASIGMDPNTALRVAQSEGFYNGLGDGGRSFGDFQLFTGGGVGNRALAAGINVRDPSKWKEQDKYALDVAKREGWAQWHGAQRVGIANWQGINAAKVAAATAGKGGGKVSSQTFHQNVTINAAGANALEVKHHVVEVLRQFERDQRGALSD